MMSYTWTSIMHKMHTRQVSALVKNVNVGVFLDAAYSRYLKLCMTMMSIELDMFIPVSKTLTHVQGHRRVCKTNESCIFHCTIVALSSSFQTFPFYIYMLFFVNNASQRWWVWDWENVCAWTRLLKKKKIIFQSLALLVCRKYVKCMCKYEYKLYEDYYTVYIYYMYVIMWM